MGYTPQQRPWSAGNGTNWQGQVDTFADLPNSVGSPYQFGVPNVQRGDLAWVTGGIPGLYLCTNPTPGAAIWVLVATGSGGSPFLLSGAGDPEGVVVAPPGTLYVNTLGGLNESLFTKVSGVGNTGWDRVVVIDRATGEILIGQNVVDHGSNAGIQYASAINNRAQLRMSQYGAVAGAPGLSAFKSRGPIGGPDAGVIDGDPLWRMACVGVTANGLLIPIAAFITIQVPTGGSQPTYVASEYELQLVPLLGPTNSRRPVFKITSQGVPVLRETIAANALTTDPAAGLATLDVAGQVVIANKNVLAGTRFTLTAQDGGTLPSGSMRVITRVVGTSFTIASTANAGDAGTVVYWQLWEGI